MADRVWVETVHPKWPRGLEKAVKKAVRLVLRQARWEGVSLPRRVEVGIRLSGDEEVRSLNRQWRGLDKPTNVLSFSPEEPGTRLLGDVVIAWETTAREAKEQGKSLRDHLLHLVVHGMWHLLGLDHARSEAEAARQEYREQLALIHLGVADPYD